MNSLMTNMKISNKFTNTYSLWKGRNPSLRNCSLNILLMHMKIYRWRYIFLLCISYLLLWNLHLLSVSVCQESGNSLAGSLACLPQAAIKMWTQDLQSHLQPQLGKNLLLSWFGDCWQHQSLKGCWMKGLSSSLTVNKSLPSVPCPVASPTWQLSSSKHASQQGNRESASMTEVSLW